MYPAENFPPKIFTAEQSLANIPFRWIKIQDFQSVYIILICYEGGDSKCGEGDQKARIGLSQRILNSGLSCIESTYRRAVYKRLFD